MNRAVVLVLASLAVVLAACGKNRQKRAGDAAPVEVVSQPVLGDAGAGSAARSDEIEPNDGEDVATLLPLGGTLRGRVDPESDADYYRVDVAEGGALGIELTAVEGMDLTLEVLDAGGTSLARSDRGAAKAREGVPNLGVAPGRYTAVVRAKKIPVKPQPAPKKPKKGAPAATAGAGSGGGSAAPVNVPVYEITAKVGAWTAGAEREPDDDRGTANDLIIGDTASGYVGWAGDADVYKLSVEALSAKNYVDIEVSSVDGVALVLEVADAAGRVLMTRKTPRSAPLVVRGFVPLVPSGAPPFHYVTIKGTSSNHEAPYQLRVSEKVPGPDAEAEPDDTPERAMPVPPDRTVVHGTWTPGDIDCYALPVEQAPRTTEITIAPPGDMDLSADVILDGGSIAKSERPGKGAEEKLVAAVPAGATAILCIKGTEKSAEGAYDVTLADGAAAP
jgi:hypothetical protein